LFRRIAPLLVLPALLASASVTAAPASQPAAMPAASTRAFVDELADEHGFDRGALTPVRSGPFSAACRRRDAASARRAPEMARLRAPLPRARTRQRGMPWWNAHAEALARAEERYGVPAEVIVAILGVETYYGRIVGRYRAIDALATLAFDYPRRAAFFRSELKEFLLLARDLGVSPLAPKGSFAGALGVPQFMPGSYRKYAVDFDGSGGVDLWASPADIVGSVAHFLAEHEWQPGQPVLLPAAIADEAREAALQRLDGGSTGDRSRSGARG
jgi:membrane-bound lytic murein transglycosylase B